MYSKLLYLLIPFCIFTTSSVCTAEPPSWPLNYSVHYLGPFNINGRVGDWTYDLFPDWYQDIDGTNTLAWLGSYDTGDNVSDIVRSTQYSGGDRVYQTKMRGSLFGWFTQIDPPYVSYKAWVGDTGSRESDDHLVGNPSTIRIGSKYYRFIESYGNWLTKVNRFKSGTDTWTTSGMNYNPVSQMLPDQSPGYSHQFMDTQNLGFAPAYRKIGTRPIYSIRVVYLDGKVNHFLSIHKTSPVTGWVREWKVLNNGNPVFYLYESAGINLKPLYAYYNLDTSDTYVTNNSSGEGPRHVADGFHGLSNGLLGYAIDSLSGGNFADGCSQNRVRMLTSLDGITWTPFKGNYSDGALVAPIERMSCAYPHSGSLISSDPKRYEIWENYGSGFPQALIRGDSIELYYTDDTEQFTGRDPDQYVGPIMWRKKVNVSSIENATAWENASRERTTNVSVYTHQPFNGPGIGAYYSSIKWSPHLKRYLDCQVNFFDGTPQIMFSKKNAPENSPVELLPSRIIKVDGFPIDRYDTGAGTCAILGTLQGQTVEHLGDTIPHISLHIVFTASEKVWGNSYFKQDFHHALVLIYL